VATFSGLSIDKVGTGYTLTATGAGSTTSTAFNITAGSATQLVFSVQPSTTTAGAAITPAVEVTAQDAGGNTATGFTGNITVAIETNPSSGTLAGTLTHAAVSGVATFPGLSIDKVGTGYTLTATGAGSTTSAAFNITAGSATQLVFSVQPSTTTAGAAITPAVQVTALDANDNTATGFSGDVTVAIGTNAGGGTLSGARTHAAVSGVATFSGLSIDKAGTGYTLTATGAGSATSAAFNITAGAAATITINAGDGQTATVGTPVPIPPSVIVRDQFGNPVPSVDVTFAPAPGSGTVEPTGSIATGADGIAAVTSWTLGQLAGPNFLTATAPAIGVIGNQVTFTATGTPAAASQLIFTTQPSPVVLGNSITPAVVVIAQDAFGNTATAFTGNVTVAIGTDASLFKNAVLGGTTSVTAASGVATFGDLTIDQLGLGYTLVVTSVAVPTGATSNLFNVVTIL